MLTKKLFKLDALGSLNGNRSLLCCIKNITFEANYIIFIKGKKFALT